MPYIHCLRCNKEFYKRPSAIKKGGRFCSVECYASDIKDKYPEANCVCFVCGKTFRTNPAYIKRHPNHKKFCNMKCYKDHLNSIEISSHIDRYGYAYVGKSNCKKKLHRYVVEKQIGRKLLKTELVHHINKNKLDNRIENLVVISAGDHARIHLVKPRKRVFANCCVCGKEMYRTPCYIKLRFGTIDNYAKKTRCQACYRNRKNPNYDPRISTVSK